MNRVLSSQIDIYWQISINFPFQIFDILYGGIACQIFMLIFDCLSSNGITRVHLSPGFISTVASVKLLPKTTSEKLDSNPQFSRYFHLGNIPLTFYVRTHMIVFSCSFHFFVTSQVLNNHSLFVLGNEDLIICSTFMVKSRYIWSWWLGISLYLNARQNLNFHMNIHSNPVFCQNLLRCSLTWSNKLLLRAFLSFILHIVIRDW